MQFEWERGKAASNRRKHGVSFDAATGVFSDPHAAIFEDPDHSLLERREIIIGRVQNRLLVVSLPNGKTISVSLVHAAQRRESESVMKKAIRKPKSEELRPEYDFDYATAKPNRFAARLKGTHTVVLDPDVAAVFTSAKAVNTLLRSAIAATGKATSKKAATAPRSRRRAA